jgi:hypothetical protein
MVPPSYRRPGADGHLARSLDLAAGHLPVSTATAGAGSPPEQAQTQADTHPHLTQPASQRPGEYDGATLRALQNGGAEFVCVGRCGFQASAAAALQTEPLPARSHSPRARVTGCGPAGNVPGCGGPRAPVRGRPGVSDNAIPQPRAATARGTYPQGHLVAAGACGRGRTAAGPGATGANGCSFTAAVFPRADRAVPAVRLQHARPGAPWAFCCLSRTTARSARWRGVGSCAGRAARTMLAPRSAATRCAGR